MLTFDEMNSFLCELVILSGYAGAGKSSLVAALFRLADPQGRILIDGVDILKIGTYTVVYSVSDAAGNAATQVERKVKVVDTTGPEITLNGLAVVTHEAGSVYTDAGASATTTTESRRTGGGRRSAR